MMQILSGRERERDSIYIHVVWQSIFRCLCAACGINNNICGHELQVKVRNIHIPQCESLVQKKLELVFDNSCSLTLLL